MGLQPRGCAQRLLYQESATSCLQLKYAFSPFFLSRFGETDIELGGFYIPLSRLSLFCPPPMCPVVVFDHIYYKSNTDNEADWELMVG